jgi:hypothetical protein
MDMGHGQSPATAATRSDPPGGHGMAVVGNDAIFLSHLPMFMRPHDYQVILEASFGPADGTFRQDRKAHPEVKLYTFAPVPFVLPELFSDAPGTPPKSTSFSGRLVRNHFEQPPAHPQEPVGIANDVVVHVIGVVHHHRLDAGAPRPKHLSYLLFGRGEERFLAHFISRPPDFDQLLAVDVSGHEFSDLELSRGVVLSVPDRPDAPKARLAEHQSERCAAHVDGNDVPVDLVVGSELYFETADLESAM